jgi:hypothetical protein
MHYWNKDNFEGLAAIAEDLRGDDFLAPIARYCDLRQKGLTIREAHEQSRRHGVERPFLTHISSVNDAPFGGW